MRISFCCIVALTFYSIDAQADSLPPFANPGFESGTLSPWFQDQIFSGTEDWNVTSVDAHSGLFSATAVGDRTIRQNFPPVLGNLVREISFWIKQPSVSSGLVSGGTAVSYHFSDGGTLVSHRPEVSADWIFIDATAIFPNSVLTGISISGYSDGTSFEPRTFVDDFTFRVVPEPSTLMLGAGGFVILLGLIRRRPGPVGRDSVPRVALRLP